ncbi:nucleotidyltransferase [candidate division KSB1 bacterium]|nr:nucleotidyltransferase [candidate division KSB1 bacterium]
MKIGDNITPLMPSLNAVQEIFNFFNDKGIIIGGVAASLLGKPRLTADVDAVIILSMQELPRLIKYAKQVGLFPRITDAEEFARRHHVLLLRHQESGIDVDISMGMLPFEIEAVERGISYQAGQLAIRMTTPEDLIIFKAVAHRPKDLLDIQAIIESHPNLDKKRIQNWVKEFARVLEMPEIWDDISKWLK